MPPQVEQFVHGRLFTALLTAVLVWLIAFMHFSSKDEEFILERYYKQDEMFGLVQELLKQVEELKDLKIVSNEKTSSNTSRSIANRSILSNHSKDIERIDDTLKRFDEEMKMLIEELRED